MRVRYSMRLMSSIIETSTRSTVHLPMIKLKRDLFEHDALLQRQDAKLFELLAASDCW